MCRRGSSHILTMDTQGGWKERAGLRRLAEPSAKSQAVRAPRPRGHGLTYDPGCIAEVACTRRVGRHAGGEKR